MSSLLRCIRNFGSTADGLFIVDAGHHVVHWNEGAHRIFGYDSREVLHKRCYEVIAGRSCPGKAWCHADCPVQRAMRSGKNPRNFDLIVRSKAGKELTTNVSIVVLSRGKESLAVHLARDISGHARDRGTLQAVLGALGVMGRLDREYGHAHEPAMDGSSSRIPLSRLTRREVEILSFIAEGVTAGEIASRLGLSSYTVRNHIQNTLKKLGLHSTTQAVSYAFKNGLV